MREIVLDTETTGLKPEDGHKVVEIGCVELINHVATGETYHVYINPERDMPTEAFEIHGLSEQFLSDKPVFAEIAAPFLEFVGDAPLVIHNASFDMKFLNYELRLAGHQTMPSERAIDTLHIARRKHPTGQNSLDALCRRYGVDNSARTKHGALLDCELLAEVYLELIGGRQPHLTLVDVKSGPRSREVAKTAYQPRPRPLPSRLSEDEAADHQAFVDTLGENAVWKKFVG